VNSVNGRWILEFPHWDFIDANTRLDLDETYSRISHLSIPNTITTINANSSASQSTSIFEMTVRDRAIVSPNYTIRV